MNQDRKDIKYLPAAKVSKSSGFESPSAIMNTSQAETFVFASAQLVETRPISRKVGIHLTFPH